jgi:site-specific recombinase XerD
VVLRPAPQSSVMTDEEKRVDMINWIRSERPENTSKSYKTYDKQFRAWCAQEGETFFPASPTTVARFLRFLLLEKGLKAGTINKSAASAIADMYKFSGVQSPTQDPLVKATKKIVAAKATPSAKRLPLTASNLVQIVRGQASRTGEFLSIRNVFLIILMFAAMMRSSEAVNLKPEETSGWMNTRARRSCTFSLKSPRWTRNVGATLWSSVLPVITASVLCGGSKSTSCGQTQQLQDFFTKKT